MTQALDQLNRKQYAVLIFIFFFQIFIGSLPTMSAFYILGDLGGGISTASYGMTLFTLGTLITKPLGVVLPNRMGHLRSIKYCAWLILVSFILVLWVQNYNAYLVLRFINGLLAGPMFLLIVRVCAEHLTKVKVEKFIHIYLILMIAAPVASAVFGGIIAYGDYWRISFLITAIFFAGGCVSLHLVFGNQEVDLESRSIDQIGFLAYGLAILALGFCIITAQVIDGFRSLAFNIVFVVGVAMLLIYFLWSLFKPNNFLNLTLFKDTNFGLIMFNAFWIIAFHFAALILLSYWLHLYVNYSVSWVALIAVFLLIGPLIVLMALKFIEYGKGLALTFTTFITMGLTTFFVSKFNVEVNLVRIVIAHTVMGCAYALYFPRIVYRLRAIAKPHQLLDAFCIFACVRSLATVLGIAYFTMLWERRFDFYYLRLGSGLNCASEPTQNLLQKLNIFNFTPSMKLAGLDEALSKQASSLALSDCFYLMFWILISLLCITFGVKCWRLLRGEKEAFQS